MEIYLAARAWPGTLGEPRNGRPTRKCQGCHCVLSAWISSPLEASAALLVWVYVCVEIKERKTAKGGDKEEMRESVKENVRSRGKMPI